jgi:ABC-2 type transport system permease protein
LLAFVALTVLVYPSIRGNPAYDQLLRGLPSAVRVFVGEQDMTSPEGYLNGRLFAAMAPLLFLVYAIGRGAAVVAGEEERGTLDLLLAHPVSRTGAVLQKFLGFATALAILGAALFLGLWAGALLVDMRIGAARLLAATVGVTLLGLLFGSLALALGCLTGKRGLSLGVTSALAVAAYVLNSFAPLVAGLQPYRWLSAFYYSSAHDPLRNGLSPSHASVLLAGTAALVAAGAWAFRRRDLAV